MGIDMRRDEGQYYPYGKRVMPAGLDDGIVKKGDFADVTVGTNTVPGLRAAVKEMAAKLGATVVSALAVCVAIGAGVETAKLNEFDLDDDPSVVTGVSFEGLATTGEVERVASDAALELAAATNEVMEVVRGEISDLGSQISDLGGEVSGLRGEISGLRTDFVAASNAFEFAIVDAKDAVDAELVALSQFAVEYADGKVNADVTIPESAARRGVSTVDMYGEDQNAAIELGRTARAAVSGATIAAAPSNTIVRSVSIAIGEHADATIDGSTRSQALAIGWHAQAKASNAIAIGMGAQHPNEDAMTGNATVASGNEAIAAGYNAKATASRAVQIGSGTNSTPNSLQFMDVPIVRDGKLAVDIPEPEIDEGVVGNIATNVYIDLLSPGPFKCQVAGDGSEPEDQNVFLAPGVFTTLQVENVGSTATNLCGDIGINPMDGARRNYSLFIEEIPEGVAYDSVAVSFDPLFENPSNRVYATPALYRDALEINFVGGEAITNCRFRCGWRLRAADVPCTIDVREPTDGVIVIRRWRATE